MAGGADLDAPLVLDTDGSVGELPGERRIELQAQQEALRLGCSLARLRALGVALEPQLAAPHGSVLLGSGDFHHLSWMLLRRLPTRRPLRVVVLDNHPDNMRFAGGVHCGSWVQHAAGLPQVGRIDVVGITSADIGLRHSWANHWRPLRSGRLRYWSLGADTRWARWAGLAHAFHDFDSLEALVEAFVADLLRGDELVYLSIDKDVFAPEVVRTNWDQGVLRPEHAERIIGALHGRIAASDITGEVSAYRYRTAWKRWVSALDGQEAGLDEARIAAWRPAQHRLNLRLLDWIAQARRA